MFFFDSNCQFCVNQWRQLNVLTKVLAPNMQMLAVSADGKPLPGEEMPGWVPDNGIIKTFGIKIYPTVALVWQPNHVALVAQGSADASSLSSNILNAAIDHDLLPKSYSRWIRPFEQGVLTPLDIKSLSEKDAKTPDALLKGVADQSLKQYQELDH
jgi:hypothetical protein